LFLPEVGSGLELGEGLVLELDIIEVEVSSMEQASAVSSSLKVD